LHPPVGSASLYLQLIEEWDCKFLRDNPSSNKLVVGPQARLWIRILELLDILSNLFLGGFFLL